MSYIMYQRISVLPPPLYLLLRLTTTPHLVQQVVIACQALLVGQQLADVPHQLRVSIIVGVGGDSLAPRAATCDKVAGVIISVGDLVVILVEDDLGPSLAECGGEAQSSGCWTPQCSCCRRRR